MTMAKTAARSSRRRGRSSDGPRFDVYQAVTDKIVAALEAGVVPWRRPWKPMGADVQRNAFSKRPYRGVNQLLLGLCEFGSPFWTTFNAAKEHGGTVKPEQARKNGGPGPELVVFWSRVKCSKCKGEEIPCDSCNGRRSFFLLRFFNVWNVEQIEWAEDGWQPPVVEDVQTEPTPDELDGEVRGLLLPYAHPIGPKVSHGGDRAYYRPSTDSVRLPAFGAFDTPEHYYATQFHELVHSTGHEDRLAREELTSMASTFGSEPYAREELVAEVGASMLCALAGVAVPELDENAAAYIGNWLTKLKGDKKLIVGASAAAQRAVDLITGATFEDAEPTNGKEK
jgi:antirestriction protein ArdC